MEPEKGIVKPTDDEVIVAEVAAPEADLPEGDPDAPREYSAIEQEAMANGWRPVEEWAGDPDKFVDAKEFMGRKPLFEKIEGNTKELKAVRKALEQFKSHYGKVEMAAYQRALNELQRQQKMHERAGEYDEADKIDAQIQAVKAQEANAKIVHETPVVVDEPAAVPTEFVSWKARNAWYDRQPHMKAYADKVGQDMRNSGVALGPEAFLARVEAEVRKYFPQEFTNPRKASAPAVESSRSQPRANSKQDDYPLSTEERQTMLSFERQGLMTRAEYIKSLKEVDAAMGLKRN